MIAAHGRCDFDATSVVGNNFDCHGDMRKISKSAAKIANSVWQGPKHEGRSGWYGLKHEAPMASEVGMGFGGLAQGACDEEQKNCKPSPFAIAESWFKYFIARDPDFDIMSMSEEQLWGYMHISRQRYDSVIGTNDPDLSEFKESGGKMISWLVDSMCCSCYNIDKLVGMVSAIN